MYILDIKLYIGEILNQINLFWPAHGLVRVVLVAQKLSPAGIQQLINVIISKSIQQFVKA